MSPDDGVVRVRATILLADFVNVDAGGKANLLGAGIRVIPLQPGVEQVPGTPSPQALTNPFGVYVLFTADVPLDEEAAVELSLHTGTGALMKIPGPDGRSQALRVAQNVTFTPASAIGAVIPAKVLPSGAQIVLNFSNGLPLREGFGYQFQVRVDHDVVASYSFYVPAPFQGPVLG